MFACNRLARAVSICLLLLMFIYTQASAEVITYQYDEANRLIEASFDGNGAVHYVYDPMGNRLARTVAADSSGNTPPLSPLHPLPSDEAVNVDPQIMLTWNGGDDDSADHVFYTLFFAEQTPLPLLRGGLSQAEYQTGTLKSFTTYHWSVSAKDNINSETESPVWSFTTGNTPPEPPETLVPENGAVVPYINFTLRWSSAGDLNPNDSVVYDVYLGAAADPPLVAEGLISPHYSPLSLWPKDTYYWKVVARDSNGAVTSSPVLSFRFTDSDQDGLPDDVESAGCTDPLNYDSDGDSIPDGVEDANLNGIVDSGEQTPCSMDSDNDGMTDDWELVYGLDPLVDDAALDSDGDGISNLNELKNGTDPTVADAGQDNQAIEGFESGDFSNFYWLNDPAKSWKVAGINPFEGGLAAHSPSLQMGESATLQTWLLCDDGNISFLYAGRTLDGGGWLNFYIDGELQGQWSGDSPYQKLSFPVTAGVHNFTWEYVREHSNDEFTEQIYLDRIVFPGLADSDEDGVHDGWELQHFGVLDQALCVDTDGDGLSDLEEAALWSSPHLVDTDGDGMDDAYEAENQLDVNSNDALADRDGDGDVNISEYLGGGNANSKDDNGFAAMETFETGNLKKFFWSQSGESFWTISTTKPHQGVFAAQPNFLGAGETSVMETQVECQKGVISFYYSLLNDNGTGTLAFYIDDILQSSFTDSEEYTQAVFEVSAGTHTFAWKYENSSGSDENNTVWIDDIVFPGVADSDNDGIVDAWELSYYASLDDSFCQDSDGDGLSDLEEAAFLSSPFSTDTDGDGMSDACDVDISYDPNGNAALADDDGDGATNSGECLAGTDPHSSSSFPVNELEDFESGDLTKFHWIVSGSGEWAATTAKAYDGGYSAAAKVAQAGGSAVMRTTLNSVSKGLISFYYALSATDTADTLEFYIDDNLVAILPVQTTFTNASFPVAKGVRQYKWVFTSALGSSAGAAWLDRIIFPGLADSDADGITDSWEYQHFNSLDTPLCGDSDGDGLNDLEEAVFGTDPNNADTDGDGMDDSWEVANGLDPLNNDANADNDGDGFNNLAEYTGNTTPNSQDDAVTSFEGFESGDLSRFHWVLTGDGAWQVSSGNAQAERYTAQSPIVADNQSASIETTIVSQGAPVSFYIATSSQASGDVVEFYINDQLMSEWSGETPYQLVTFDVPAGTNSFTWTYRKDGDVSEGQDTVWLDSITFPGAADSDGDGIIDGWELRYFNTLEASLCGDSDDDGLKDIDEALAGTNPTTSDTDGDGMDDNWEVTHGLDPLYNDGAADGDGDGFTNLAEYMGNGDPNSQDLEVSSFEGFESGDLSRFHWVISGEDAWQVSQYYIQAGRYTARSPIIADSQLASMETTILSQGAPISFYVSASSQAGGDVLEFYINDQLMGEWSGETPYELVSFDVPAGRNSFTWTYKKDGETAEGADRVWLDSINFPGPADSDGDNIIDGWEFRYFDTLDASLCGDSDGDGLEDIDEAMAGTNPFAVDTDGDGMDDNWEVANGLDPLQKDGAADVDGDGYNNLAEYMGQGDPNSEDMALNSFEGFESGDFSSFYWVHSGDNNWQVNSTNAQADKFSAQSPAITDNQSTSIQTTIFSQSVPISFYIATSSQANSDVVEFYINDQLMGEWSGETPYQLVSFDVPAGINTFTWTYRKDGEFSEGDDTVWLDSITFPGPADSDGDGIADGWEYRYFDTLDAALCGDSDGDGLKDIDEALSGTNPHSADTDGDGMDDNWEIANGLDPRKDDALEDPDGDGVANYYEYTGKSNPDTLDEQNSESFEGFESGDLSRFDWVISGDGSWQVAKSNPWSGNYSDTLTGLSDNQSGTLETTMKCDPGPIRFYVATSSQPDGDILEFSLNGVIQGQWSGDTPYQQVSFMVPQGRNTFTWTYRKDGSVSTSEDTVWLDNISFPGKADSDGDGILDGWEYRYFNTLDHAPCGDADNDGLLDLEELIAGTDPLNPDSDGDGVLDGGVVAPAQQRTELMVTQLTAAEFESKTSEIPAANIIVLEDAEDVLLRGWDVFDNDPYGARIDVTYDSDRDSQVLDFFGSGIDNGYRFRNEDGSWLTNTHTVLQWDIKSQEHFVIYAAVQTTDGIRYLQYEPVDEDLLGDDEIVKHGLGQFIDDNSWHTIVRDLAFDLGEAQPNNKLQSILGFLVRGNCQVDNIMTRAVLPVNQDSDEDGITDSDEIHVTKTHPYYADSDGDGIGDGEEKIYWGDSWNHDDDNDGLINILDADSDNDGILDGEEMN